MDNWGGNDDVAERMRRERERRGMSYRQLSAAMEREGCKIAPSALQRIEKGAAPGKPSPKIGVAELVAACRVFGISPSEMVQSADWVRDRLLESIVARHRQAVQQIEQGLVHYLQVRRHFLGAWIREYPDADDALGYVAAQIQKTDRSPHIDALELGIGERLDWILATLDMIGSELVMEEVRRGGVPVRYPDLAAGTPGPTTPEDWRAYLSEVSELLAEQEKADRVPGRKAS